MSNLNNFIAIIDEGLLGLTMYLAPDYIFNPHDGVIPALLVKTLLENNHLHVASQIALCGAGATLVVSLISRLFLCKTPQQETLLAKFRMLYTMMTLPLILQLAITNPGGMFSRKLFILLAAFKAVSVLAQVREAKNWVQPTAIKMSRSAWECLLLGLYGLPISVGLLFFPDRVASYFYNFHPPLQVVEIDPLMRFCFRFEGAQLTAFAITVLGEVKNLPKTCLGLCRLLFSLLILLYLRAFADESGSINNGFFRINFAIHVGLITATWCRTLWWLSDDEMIEEHGAAATTCH